MEVVNTRSLRCGPQISVQHGLSAWGCFVLVDAASLPGWNVWGVGVVIVDLNGGVLGATAKQFSSLYSPLL